MTNDTEPARIAMPSAPPVAKNSPPDQLKRLSRKSITAPDIPEDIAADGYEELPDAIDADQDTAERFASIPRKAQQIAALRATGSTCQEIADLVGDTLANVRYYVQRYQLQRVNVLSPAARKAFLAARFSQLSHRAINSITPIKMQAASAVALATVAGIASDKAAKLREEIAVDQAREAPTAIAALRARSTRAGATSPGNDRAPLHIDVGDDAR